LKDQRKKETPMKHVMVTKVFTNGNSQAVRLPRQFRLEEDEVCIAKEDDRIVIFPKPKQFSSLQEIKDFFDSIHCADFELERDLSLAKPIDL
jgi:antitoxin VapB